MAFCSFLDTVGVCELAPPHWLVPTVVTFKMDRVVFVHQPPLVYESWPTRRRYV